LRSAKDLGISLEERWPDVTPLGREVLEDMYNMTHLEFLESLVDAGIYTPDGELTANYRDDAEPSVCRPTLSPYERAFSDWDGTIATERSPTANAGRADAD
jgi:hypothetical protein